MGKTKKWESVSRGQLNLLEDDDNIVIKKSTPADAGKAPDTNAYAKDEANSSKKSSPTNESVSTTDASENITETDENNVTQVEDDNCENELSKEALEALQIDGAHDVIDDWDVVKALKTRRRVFHLIRHYDNLCHQGRMVLKRKLKSSNFRFFKGQPTRGLDWDIVNGEIGMTRAWCYLNGIANKVERVVGKQGLISCVMRTRSRSFNVVICSREDNGVSIPVRVVGALTFMKNMLIEARESTNSYIAAYSIPHTHY